MGHKQDIQSRRRLAGLSLPFAICLVSSKRNTRSGSCTAACAGRHRPIHPRWRLHPVTASQLPPGPSHSERDPSGMAKHTFPLPREKGLVSQHCWELGWLSSHVAGYTCCTADCRSTASHAFLGRSIYPAKQRHTNTSLKKSTRSPPPIFLSPMTEITPPH